MSSSSEKPEVSAAELSDNSRDVEASKPEMDTAHTDEAMKVLANYTGEQTWTDQEEKKLRRKVDWKLLPIMCMTYTLQYYDKAMISQAVSGSHVCVGVCAARLTMTVRLFLDCARISV
jgi:hypothetical protein